MLAQDEGAFWNARPELARIRQFAWSRVGSPWAYLGKALARVIAAMPVEVVLPGIIGGQVGAGLYVALMGRPGAGKGSSGRGVSELIPDLTIRTCGLGSGSGFTDQYREYRKPDRGHAEDSGSVVWIRHSVLFQASEAGTLEALFGRSGSDLEGFLRQAWQAEMIAPSYRDKVKRIDLPALEYRACLTVDLTPSMAPVLMKGRADGTPQRFAFLPATDPLMPGLDDLPDDPGPLAWNPPRVPFGRHCVAGIPPEVRREIRAQAVAVQRGELYVPELDMHRNLLRLILALGLDVLHAAQGEGEQLHHLTEVTAAPSLIAPPENPYEVTAEGWRLAGMIMVKSDETRAALLADAAMREAKVNEVRGKAEGERAVFAEQTAGERRMKLVGESLKRLLADGEWHPRGKLRGRLRVELRPSFDAAIAQGVSEGAVEAEDISRADGQHGGGKGMRYRLSSGYREAR